MCAGERRYRRLFEQSSDAILTMSSGMIRDANAAAVVLFGYDKAELIARAVLDLLIDPQDAHLFTTTGLSEKSCSKLRRKDGTAIDARLLVMRSAINGDDDAIIIRDVTPQLTMERQFQQAQKMEAVGHLASGIAHDFNNLLTAIGGYSELLISNLPEEDPNIQDVYEIRRAAGSAAQLTKHLLALTRRQESPVEIVNINRIVSRMAATLRRTIGEDILVTLRLDPSVKGVKADPTHLEQVVLNLAINARDAMPHGGNLRLTTSRHSGDDGLPAKEYVRLEVMDTGCGIPEELQAQIFEPFFTTKGAAGTGLGLATVSAITKELGGRIRLDSTAGAGTTFTIDLPAAGESAPAVEAVAAPPRFHPGYATVLVVEDDPRVRELTEIVLRRAGHDVFVADGPRQALAAINDYPHINVVLTDVVMPDMNGYQLAEELQGIVPGLRCVFMSGFSGEGRDMGARFVAKPFSAESLTAAIQHAITVA